MRALRKSEFVVDVPGNITHLAPLDLAAVLLEQVEWTGLVIP
jgi:hypothetical protein